MNLEELRITVAENLDSIKPVSDGVEMVTVNRKRADLLKEIIPKIAEAFTVTFLESELDFGYTGFNKDFYLDVSLLTICADELRVTEKNKESAKYLYDALNQYSESISVYPGFDDGITIKIGFPGVTRTNPANGIVFGDREDFTVAQKRMCESFRKLIDNDFNPESP